MVRLSKTQRRVMEWLGQGHRAYLRYGSVLYVNGGKLCTLSTMIALLQHGFVTQEDSQTWVATDKGKQWWEDYG